MYRSNKIASLRASLISRRGFEFPGGVQTHQEVADYVAKQIATSGLTHKENKRLSSRIEAQCLVSLSHDQDPEQFDWQRPDFGSHQSMQSVDKDTSVGSLPTQSQTWLPPHDSSQTLWEPQAEGPTLPNYQPPIQQDPIAGETYMAQQYSLPLGSHTDQMPCPADGLMPQTSSWAPYFQTLPSCDLSGFGPNITVLSGRGSFQEQ